MTWRRRHVRVPALPVWRAVTTAAVVLVLALFVAGCGGQAGDTATTATNAGTGTAASASTIPAGAIPVVMKNTAFAPADVTIKAGQTVAWVNQDSMQHDVVANDGSFRSQLLDTGQVFTFTFSKAGSFPYYCAIHPQMKGTVTVQP